MSKSKNQSTGNSYQLSSIWKFGLFCSLITVTCSLFVGCRYDMQDQPRYKAYKESDFFTDKRASRNLPEGTVPRGYLREDKAFYTGKTGESDGDSGG